MKYSVTKPTNVSVGVLKVGGEDVHITFNDYLYNETTNQLSLMKINFDKSKALSACLYGDAAKIVHELLEEKNESALLRAARDETAIARHYERAAWIRTNAEVEAEIELQAIKSIRLKNTGNLNISGGSGGGALKEYNTGTELSAEEKSLLWSDNGDGFVSSKKGV